MTMSDNTPLVSVITPMYRVEDLLPRGLDYLLNQTYQRLELLFVDDCSPDKASEIIEQYRSRFEALGMVVRLLLHSENQGVAVARNTALEAATGEFIYSFDADDELAPNAIELMVTEALNKDADVVGCEWSLVYQGSRRPMTQPEVKTGKEAFQAMCQGVMKWNLWLWLFRRSLLSQEEGAIRFLPQMNMGEDMMLMGKVFLRANKVSILHTPLYGYVKTNAGSLTNNYSEDHWRQVDTNLIELEQYTQCYGTEEQQEEIQFLKLNLKLPLLISPRKVDYEHWSNWFPEANSYIMRNPALPMRTKLVQWAANKHLWVLVRLYYEVIMKFLYNILYK